MTRRHFQPHKRNFKWIRRIILILLAIFLGITIVGTINNGFQWLLDLLAKIFPFGFGSGDFNGKNLFPDKEIASTIDPAPTSTVTLINTKTLSTVIPTIVLTNKPTETIIVTSTPTITSTPTVTLVPVPTITPHANNIEKDALVNSYVTAEIPVTTPTPNPSPLPKIKPTPNKESIIKYVYFDETLVSALKENVTVIKNEITFVILFSSLKTNLSNVMVETTITKDTFKALIDMDIYSIDLPFKTLNISEVYNQLEETGTDYIKLEWFLDENNEYRMKIIFKKNGLDIYELFYGERWSIYY